MSSGTFFVEIMRSRNRGRSLLTPDRRSASAPSPTRNMSPTGRARWSAGDLLTAVQESWVFANPQPLVGSTATAIWIVQAPWPHDHPPLAGTVRAPVRLLPEGVVG